MLNMDQYGSKWKNPQTLVLHVLSFMKQLVTVGVPSASECQRGRHLCASQLVELSQKGRVEQESMKQELARLEEEVKQVASSILGKKHRIILRKQGPWGRMMLQLCYGFKMMLPSSPISYKIRIDKIS